MGKIYLLIPYFGSFPTYFQLYLDSVAINKDILNVLILTDINTSSYKIPDNVTITYMTLEDVRERIRFFMKNQYNMVIKRSDILKITYKLCDFRSIYFSIFADKLDCLNLNESDYVGWGDIDVIFGKISNFLNIDKNSYSFIGIHGHFTTFRYTKELITLYKKIENLEGFLLDQKYFGVDELHIRQVIVDMINKDGHSEFLVRAHFCDILPSSGKMVPTFNKNARINHLMFDRTNRTLSYLLADGTCKETFYAHLQKRHMKVNFDTYRDVFFIKDSSFDLIP